MKKKTFKQQYQCVKSFAISSLTSDHWLSLYIPSEMSGHLFVFVKNICFRILFRLLQVNSERKLRRLIGKHSQLFSQYTLKITPSLCSVVKFQPATRSLFQPVLSYIPAFQIFPSVELCLYKHCTGKLLLCPFLCLVSLVSFCKIRCFYEIT